MAKGYTTRQLEVWSLHAHTGPRPVPDYEAMFHAIASADPKNRQIKGSERVVALPRVEVTGSRVYLVAYEGPTGQPIIFDTDSSEERRQPLRRPEIVATRTYALVDIATREVIIEYNHRGAKAADIASLLGVAGRNGGMSSLWVELNPKVDHTFIQGIDSFERIRVASLRMARPNYDWTKYDDAYAQQAADSEAQSVTTEFIARRGESLSHDEGIVPYIKRRSRDAKATLKSAFVIGRREGDAGESKLSLNDHKEKVRVNVRLTQDSHVDETDMRRRLDEYFRARREGSGD